MPTTWAKHKEIRCDGGSQGKQQWQFQQDKQQWRFSRTSSNGGPTGQAALVVHRASSNGGSKGKQQMCPKCTLRGLPRGLT
eukprot:scaffold85426_cov20-Tisochrysis_lutea.AAC.1